MLSKTLILSLTPVAIALLSGAMLPFQATANAAVGKLTGHPLWAAAVSLVISLAVLLPLIWYLKLPAPRIGTAVQGPWWLWIGGVMGALYVFSAAAFAAQLGAGGFLALVVAGQMVAAVAVDHFGLMNLTPRPVTLMRGAGVALILIGAFCMQYGGKPAAGQQTGSQQPGPGL